MCLVIRGGGERLNCSRINMGSEERFSKSQKALGAQCGTGRSEGALDLRSRAPAFWTASSSRIQTGARLGHNQENEGSASAACREVARIVTHNRMLALVCSRCQPLATVARTQGLSCKARRTSGREKRPGRYGCEAYPRTTIWSYGGVFRRNTTSTSCPRARAMRSTSADRPLPRKAMAAIAAAVFVIDFPLRLSFLNATGRQVFQKSGHGEERRAMPLSSPLLKNVPAAAPAI